MQKSIGKKAANPAARKGGGLGSAPDFLCPSGVLWVLSGRHTVCRSQKHNKQRKGNWEGNLERSRDTSESNILFNFINDNGKESVKNGEEKENLVDISAKGYDGERAWGMA
ncbi:unnamed protein product [Bursaphelenchus xylophilus]|uniref:(pine wood nematode) hypothetical protein n=1 Tax=Bursaphelenchus xylophilus TaxID=6326 RepID=A0A1I7SQB6_BURXY|nr:unnamed protein product [Bursaphelenchus xylophilus]CAG9109698.1 unnamed protein product [Bursaphelenchus xylophilus]